MWLYETYKTAFSPSSLGILFCQGMLSTLKAGKLWGLVCTCWSPGACTSDHVGLLVFLCSSSWSWHELVVIVIPYRKVRVLTVPTVLLAGYVNIMPSFNENSLKARVWTGFNVLRWSKTLGTSKMQMYLSCGFLIMPFKNRLTIGCQCEPLSTAIMDEEADLAVFIVE